MLKLKPISWRANPAQMKDDIDSNFRVIESSFSEIVQNKLQNLEVKSVDIFQLKIQGKDIDELFVKPSDFNIEIKGDEKLVDVNKKSDTKFDISISTNPKFNSIESDTIRLKGKDIEDIFITKEQSQSLAKYTFDKSLFDTTNGIISIKSPKHQTYLSVSANTMEASFLNTKKANIVELKINGKPIEQLFGSHTFVSVDSENLYTSGTPYQPTIHLKDSPNFESLSASTIQTPSLMANNINATSVSSKSINSLGNLSFVDGDQISRDNTLLNGFVFINGNDRTINIGIEPENEISSFKRTSLRIVPKRDDIIHHAFLIQTSLSKKDRDISDKNTQFVIKGNGHVGIGKYQTTSKVDIFSENGYDQLRLSKSYTPQTSHEQNGSEGNITWDDDFIYVKTTKGWKRAQLFSFS